MISFPSHEDAKKIVGKILFAAHEGVDNETSALIMLMIAARVYEEAHRRANGNSAWYDELECLVEDYAISFIDAGEQALGPIKDFKG